MMSSQPYDADPPARAARLSYLEGDVSLQPAGEEAWALAQLNRPLTSGDKLWTERNARAEIQVGPADVRLDHDTGFSFLNVDDHTIQMRVTAGVVNVSMRTLRDDEQIEIDTPNIAFTILRPGSYRVEVNDAGDRTVVKVSEGAVQATGPSQDLVVHARQQVTFNGIDELVAQLGTLGASDEFDSWNLDRDRRAERAASSRSAQYVSPEVTGYEDLDDHGTWSSEPDYGYVWTPRYVAVGWSPYRYGRWVWISPWGWTWIDDAPWGYAPFHYGRWAHIRHRWCWVPGPRHTRAVFAPALVGWVRAHHTHVSWIPLGPRDVYVPDRRVSRRYLERVNFANAVIDRARLSAFAERRGSNLDGNGNGAVPDAVTAAPRTAFTSSQRIGDLRVRIDEREMARNRESVAAPDIAPARESRLGGTARANPRIPRDIANRQVVVKREPPPSVARFTRRPVERNETWQAPAERTARSQDPRRPDRPDIARPVAEPRIVAQPDREERRSSVFDSRAIAERVREDRERQGRESLQRQREAEDRQHWQRQEDQPRQLRDVWQARREQQDRERAQHRQDSERPRVERPQAERPQVHQPRERTEAPPPAAPKPQPHRRQEGDPRPRRD